jgi:hypothetical protein
MNAISAPQRGSLILFLTVMLLTIGFIGGAAFAQPRGPNIPDDMRARIGPETALKEQLPSETKTDVGLLASTASGGAITAVRAVREDVVSSTNSTTFVNVPGASASITVPAGQAGVFLAIFSAESSCEGPIGWCSVRLMITSPAGTFEMVPQAGSDFAFDSTSNGTETNSWESHAVQRSYSISSSNVATTWTIQVQQMVTASGITLRLDDWMLRVDKTL